MLDGRNDVVGLDAADGMARQRPGEQRVFAEIFEIAAVAGSRIRFAPPASRTLKPFARASPPIIRPPCSMRSGFQVEAIDRPDGSAVAPSLRMPPIQATPRLASVSRSDGTPSCGSPAI